MRIEEIARLTEDVGILAMLNGKGLLGFLMNTIAFSWLIVAIGCAQNVRPARRIVNETSRQERPHDNFCFPAKGTMVVADTPETFALNIETLQAKLLYRAREHQRVKSAVPLAGIDGDFLLVVCNDQDSTKLNESLLRLSSKSHEPIELQQALSMGVPVVSPDGTSVAWISEGRDKKTRLWLAPVSDCSQARFFPGDLFVDNTGPSWVESAKDRNRLLVTMSNGTIAVFDERSSSFSQKTRGYCPFILNGEDRFLFFEGERGENLAIFDHGAIHRICRLFYQVSDWYSTIRASPDGRYAATMGPVSCRILGFLTKESVGLVLIDLETGQMESVSGNAEGRKISFLGGPWAWLKN